MHKFSFTVCSARLSLSQTSDFARFWTFMFYSLLSVVWWIQDVVSPEVLLYKHWINPSWSGACLLFEGHDLRWCCSSYHLVWPCLIKETCITKPSASHLIWAPWQSKGEEWPRPRDNKIQRALVLQQQIPALMLELWGSLNDLNAIHLLLLAFGVGACFDCLCTFMGCSDWARIKVWL